MPEPESRWGAVLGQGIKLMPGPKGKGGFNRDSYDGTAPMNLPPTPPKQINATDSKQGSPAPGTVPGAGINTDTYHE